MKSDFLVAITQLAGEKNLPREKVFEAVEAALAAAYKRDTAADAQISVKINTETGMMRVFRHWNVVEEVETPDAEMTLPEARKVKPDARLGEDVIEEMPVKDPGRIQAQTAKQVVLQRLRETEREAVYEEYVGKEGDIISGVVQRLEGRNVILDLGKTEALLPGSEQVRVEHYRPAQRVKVLLLRVDKQARGPQVIVSRAHRDLIRRLFELEVPEIHRGTVEVKSIAREPGFRSKVAVWSRQDGIDPVGACVGLRGIRIQNVVNELGGERIDVVQWDPDPERFVAHALSPARVVDVKTDEESNTATVVVPDQQLSLAIGKEGQNARLAAKLTGWRIDIKSEAMLARQAAGEEVSEEEAAAAGTVFTTPLPSEEEIAAIRPQQPEVEELPAVAAAVAALPDALEDVVPAGVADTVETPEEAVPEPAVAAAPAAPAPSGIRFADEIGAGRRGGPRDPRRRDEEEAEAEAAARRARTGRGRRRPVEEEDDDDPYAEYAARFR